MRRERLMLLASMALWLAACHPKRLHHGAIEGFDVGAGPMKPVEQLTCPDRVDRLQRTGRAGDGRSCTYSGSEGEDVRLSLIPLDGATAVARLAALDATLKTELPGASNAAGVHIEAGDGAGQHAKIDLPGFHLDADDGKASLRMPGVDINADGDKAQVSTGLSGHGQAVVNAHEGGAEIRAGGVGANGTDETYLLASDTAGPTGYKVVGYIAKGPTSGPLVVGVFRSRDHHGHDRSDHGLDRLIDMNTRA